MAIEGRSGDLVLSQGTYALIQDGATGTVEVVTGPHKVSLADTDKPVIYEKDTRRFISTDLSKAVSVCPAADEGQYLVLTNPSKDELGLKHPAKGKQSSVDLTMGRKINVQGPVLFPLYPGQVAEVIDGHQLKSNEYLLIRVYNEQEAKQNLKNAVVKTAEGAEVTSKTKSQLFEDKEIRTGNLLIIKGTDVSFYMPPTGISGQAYGTLFGRPVIPIEQASAIGDVGDIILADMNEYLLIEKGGIEGAASIHVRFLYDESVFRFILRIDGQPKRKLPLTPYKGGNTLSPFIVLEAR